ncbi:MAG: DUF262 domain-containing protein [Bacteroidota bacterium]|nr:DUF262 domain-containing protein [Bacteroidota bacterium]
MSKKTSAYLKEENLLTLLSQNNFIVPEIQREYVWGENKKVIVKFLNDLKNKIGICCSECNLPSSENKINIGFLYSYKPDYVKIEHDRFLDENLIDGQQRFTTLFLLLFYCALKESRADGKNRKDEFLTLIRFEEKIRMSFDFRVRDLTKRFMLELVEKVNTIEQLQNIDKQTWFLKDYQNDVSIKSIRKAFGFIQSVFSDSTRYYNHLINYIVFWHFKTEATSQGEELYITMNARGEELADNEITKAALMVGGSEIYEWGKKWEEWQQFFWKKRDKNDPNPSADKGLNGFLSCIAGLEYYLKDKQGVIAEKEINSLLTLEKVEQYFEALTFLHESRAEFEQNYNYTRWIDSCLKSIWEIFNNNQTDWFADYKDKNKSTERNRMVFMWSWLYYITESKRENTLLKTDELYRLLRFFYIRKNNFNRSVSTLKKTVDLIIINGVWDTMNNELGSDQADNLEEETDSKFRTKEEDEKNIFFYKRLLDKDLKEIEELIWQIEDHTLNLDGSDVGNINITHLIDLNDMVTTQKLEEIRDAFEGLFPNGVNLPLEPAILNTVLLYYGDFYKSKEYSNGSKYDFADWKRNIRKNEFKKVIMILTEKPLSVHLSELNRNFIEEHQLKITNAKIALSEGFNIREKLIFYTMLLKPDGIWQCGNVIIEYGQVNGSRLFKDEEKFIYNLKSDFRSWYFDLWEKAKESYENPLFELKKLIL